MIRITGKDVKSVSDVKKRVDDGEIVGVSFTPDGVWRIDFVIVKVEFINYAKRQEGEVAIPGAKDDDYLFAQTNGAYKNYTFGTYVNADYVRSKFDWPACKENDSVTWFVNAIVAGICTDCQERIDECRCGGTDGKEAEKSAEEAG